MVVIIVVEKHITVKSGTPRFSWRVFVLYDYVNIDIFMCYYIISV